MASETTMKKTLGLTGVTVNAMALIAPGAFLWLTYQVQAAQVDTAGKTTGADMFAGLVFALLLAFLTAISYATLAELYPEAGTGSSYYFAEHAFLSGQEKLPRFARLAKFLVGWFSHLYYWVYPGVMVAMFATMITYIAGQFGLHLSVPVQVLIAAGISFLTGAVAYRGINGSTASAVIINVIQIVTLVFITVLALVYRLTNPEHVRFVHASLSDIVLPHSISNVLFQATIAILLLVGFESTTALAAESKSPKHVSRGVILSLILQGLIFYLFEYFGANAWINTSYTVKSGGTVYKGLSAAANSGAPIGDMVRNLGNVLLNQSGFALMVAVAVTVGIAIFGSTLACMNTGVRVTYAMSKDREAPGALGLLHPKHATPHTGVWVITLASALIGAFGVISIRNLTAVTLLSNVGTFILYGMTNLISLVAYLHHPKHNKILHVIVPVLGTLANVGMLLAVIYLGILGGGDTRMAALMAIVGTAVWTVLGIVYLVYNSRKLERKILVGTTSSP
ncbi:Amino acid/polyamine transporter I [Acididesulfobacillus acetoxydans]|uniref:Amino acid permease-associated region n=1 Tax=Acididesulfobacillus acetoxydans TaxID=1561005 RepID=A0A8S0Y365_9FIRM|nr:APC family permease [Acididesulfobacillus acetoxydans]CAA7601685.1 Amino acid/polyamine transporter I [Acididesulfobacillus acetoxydans]CEJ09096.1 Amino acid permease-associated region [Acididesulfobacillus acetoxydans]